MTWWEARREQDKRLYRQLLIGLPVGLLFTIPIIIMVFSAKFWYQRADMEANAMINPSVLIVAILIIAVFIAIFHKRHQWDMREQQYQELKAREERENDSGAKQQ